MTRRQPKTDSRIAIGYIRVSTDRQELGPEAQRAAVEAWAARQGVQVVAWHEDRGVSGAAPIDKRPALLAALASLAEHGAAVLVAAKRCRIARDVVAAAMIERLAAKAGATVATADGVGDGDGPEAALMRTMVDAFAQYERAMIRSRTRAALAAKRDRGERTGQVPLGYQLADDGVALLPDLCEQRTIAQVRALRDAGRTIDGIATQLNSERVPARGSKWHATTVRRLLARDRPAA